MLKTVALLNILVEIDIFSGCFDLKKNKKSKYNISLKLKSFFINVFTVAFNKFTPSFTDKV